MSWCGACGGCVECGEDTCPPQPPESALDAWCAQVDAAVAEGVDPFTALVDADLEYPAARAVQLSLDRD